jgi:uncharacterized protein YrrD
MDLNKGASVHTTDGRAAGHIERVVLDPKTKEVTDVVVRKGLLFTRDKVVPIADIHAEPDQPLVIQLSADKLDELPDYEETKYIVADEDHLADKPVKRPDRLAPAVYWYPPYLESPMMPAPAPSVIKTVQVNIPTGTVAVKEGALVLTRDEKHAGTVEKVLTDTQTSQVTHLLISTGTIQKEKRLVPVAWIDSMDDKEVRLTVGSAVVEKLPLFEHS